MQITLEIPDEFASQVASEGHDPARAALEAIALETYRQHRFTTEQVRRFLGFATRFEVDGFLKKHGVYLNLAAQDVERDAATSREFRERCSSLQTLRP